MTPGESKSSLLGLTLLCVGSAAMLAYTGISQGRPVLVVVAVVVAAAVAFAAVVLARSSPASDWAALHALAERDGVRGRWARTVAKRVRSQREVGLQPLRARATRSLRSAAIYALVLVAAALLIRAVA